MKSRIIFSLLCFIIFGQIAYSQPGRFQLGVLGGPNISSYTGSDPYVEYSAVIGYSLASTVQYNFSAKFSLVSGLGYDKKGNKSSVKSQFRDWYGDTELQTDVSYMTLPLMLRYSFGKGKLKGFANLGGYLGFLLKTKWYEYEADPNSGQVAKNEKKFEQMDLGVSLGLGLGYSITKRLNLTFEIRDSYGVYYLNTKSTGYYYPNQKTKMPKSELNSINFLIGLNMKMGSLKSK